MTFLLIILLGVVLFLIVGFSLGSRELGKRKDKQDTIDLLLKENEFSPSQIFISEGKKSCIAFNDESKEIVIVNIFDNETQFTKISANDIIESQTVEDGLSLVKTSRSSMAGGALVGGLLLGGVGAIIGGLSAKKTQENEVFKLQIQLVVNDTTQPIQTITFLDKNYAIKKSSPIYKMYYEKMNHWHKLISVLIKQTENNQKSIMS